MSRGTLAFWGLVAALVSASIVFAVGAERERGAVIESAATAP